MVNVGPIANAFEILAEMLISFALDAIKSKKLRAIFDSLRKPRPYYPWIQSIWPSRSPLSCTFPQWTASSPKPRLLWSQTYKARLIELRASLSNPWHMYQTLASSDALPDFTPWLLVWPTSIPQEIDLSLPWPGLFDNSEIFQMILARSWSVSQSSSWFYPFGARKQLSELSSAQICSVWMPKASLRSYLPEADSPTWLHPLLSFLSDNGVWGWDPSI